MKTMSHVRHVNRLTISIDASKQILLQVHFVEGRDHLDVLTGLELDIRQVFLLVLGSGGHFHSIKTMEADVEKQLPLVLLLHLLLRSLLFLPTEFALYFT